MPHISVLMEDLWRDFVGAWKTLLRSPGFSGSAVLALALGIGANVTVFSFLNVLMLRPLPVKDPDQLIQLLHQYPGDPRLNGFSFQTYEHIRDHNQVLSGLIALSRSTVFARQAGEDAEKLTAEVVNGDYFPTLGMEATRGRLLNSQDDRPGSIPTAVISYAWWTSRFQRNPEVMGMTLLLDSVPVTIVGVAPRRFVGLETGTPSSIWISHATEAQVHPGRRPGAGILGRLRPGASIETATADLERLYRNSFSEEDLARDPNWRRAQFFVESARSGLGRLQEVFRKPLRFLMIAAGMLLLLTCTNVAGLLLAQGISRQKERSIQTALGAGTVQLARTLLAEAVLLSAAAAIAGTIAAHLGTQALAVMLASGREHERVELFVEPDGTVLLFVIGLMLFTCLLAWAIPLWQTLHAAPADALRNIKSVGMGRRSAITSKLLVAGQVSVSVALLVTASLLLQHVWNLSNAGLGFNPEHLVLVSLDPAGSGYNRSQLAQIHHELASRLSAIPGVESAAFTAATPISGAGASRFVSVEGYEEEREQRRYVSLNWVGPGFLGTYQIPLITGRDFVDRDRVNPVVVLVNQSFARHYFGAENPVGRRLHFDGDQQTYEVIGLVGDTKFTELREAPPRTCYLMAFHPDHVVGNTWSIRSTASLGQLLPTLHQVIKDAAPGIKQSRVTTMATQMDAAIVPERMIASIAGAFAATGLALTVVALFSLLSYTVTRRVNEFGVRMCLGASPYQCGLLVVSSSTRVVLVGVAVGAGLAVGVNHFATRFVGDLPFQSATPFVLAGLVLLTASITASAWPVYRAARVSAAEAIRAE